MPPNRAWQPLLAGALALEATEAVEGIAEAIDARTWPDDDGSVAAGAAGFALLYAYLARVTGDSRQEERALRHLGSAVESAGAEMGASLIGGVAGVGWVAEHLSLLLGVEDADPQQNLEHALVALLEHSKLRVDHELLFGLAGFVVYALQRLPRPAACICLERALEGLAEGAERGPSGVTWRTPAESIPEHRREEAPHGYYDLGVAHGVPGVLPPLAAAATRAGSAHARGLLNDAVGWLLTQRLEGVGGSCFPFWVAPGRAPRPARSAWCYGDPGIAAALFTAAETVGVEDWQREALAVARRAAARPGDETGVIDAGLCHGAAGLGHVFNRIYQASGDERVREAASVWFERALRMRSPAVGVAGYQSMLNQHPDGGPRVDDPSFLTGAAGIALALLAATTDVEPGWDRLLGLSVDRGVA